MEWRGAMAKVQIFLRDFLNEARKAKVVAGSDVFEHLKRAMFMIKWYGEDSERRAQILSLCTNLYLPVARRRSPQEAQQLIEDVVECGSCSEETLFGLVNTEEIIKNSDAKEIWKLLFKSRWPDKQTTENGRLMANLLEDVLDLELLDAGEFVNAIGSGFMAMPSPQRELVFMAARKGGDAGIMKAMPPRELVLHLTFTTLERVLIALAEKQGWVGDVAVLNTEGPPSPVEVAGNGGLEEAEVQAIEEEAIIESCPSKDADDPAPNVVIEQEISNLVIDSQVNKE